MLDITHLNKMVRKLKVNPTFDNLSPGQIAYRSPGDPVLKRKDKYKVVFVRKPAFLKPLTFSGCWFKNCEYTDGQVDESTDLIAFFGPCLSVQHELPKRWPHQVYVMSPINYNGDLTTSGNPWQFAFNLTVTYRHDSDIWIPNSKLAFVGNTEDTVNLSKSHR